MTSYTRQLIDSLAAIRDREAIQVRVKHDDRGVEYVLAVHASTFPDLSIDRIEKVLVIEGVFWVGREPGEFAPATDSQAMLMGAHLLSTLREEIEEAVREEISRRCEQDD